MPAKSQGEMFCNFQIIDNHGRLNCTAIDGSIGLCSFELCPRQMWQLRHILKQAARRLVFYFGFDPALFQLVKSIRRSENGS